MLRGVLRAVGRLVLWGACVVERLVLWGVLCCGALWVLGRLCCGACLVLWGAHAVESLVLRGVLCAVGCPCCGVPMPPGWGIVFTLFSSITSHPPGSPVSRVCSQGPSLHEAGEQHHCIAHSMCPEWSGWGRGDSGRGGVGHVQGAFTEPW